MAKFHRMSICLTIFKCLQQLWHCFGTAYFYMTFLLAGCDIKGLLVHKDIDCSISPQTCLDDY